MSQLSTEQIAQAVFGNQYAAWPGKLTQEQQDQIRESMDRLEAKISPDVGVAVVGSTKRNADGSSIYTERDAAGNVVFTQAIPRPDSGTTTELTETQIEELVLDAAPVEEMIEQATEEAEKEDKDAVLTYLVPHTKRKAHTFLEEAATTMKQRAELRDADDGERTAAQIAKVFNAITGHDLSEADAWMFLVVLKIVRSRNGKFNADDYIDLAAYAGLLGECESQNR